MRQDFGLAQIFPLADEDADNAPQVVSASFMDPFVSIVRNDGSVMVLRVDESGDLYRIEKDAAVSGGKWTSSSLYEDSNDLFRLDYGDDEEEMSNVLLFLLSAAGGLYVSYHVSMPMSIGR